MIRGGVSFFVLVCRILKNEKAGIDITIPEYKEVSGRLGLSNEEETGLKRIYRPDYRDPIEKQEEPEVNPADIEDDLKRYDSCQ